MKKYKKIMVDVVSDIVCDICDKSCSEPQSGLIEYAVLEALWGREQFNKNLIKSIFFFSK
jgi:hypothetical protein